ncbi:MAG: hypothetical protein JOY69_08510 [Candidatus Eremiobacteraeota bacterium]|nr:hypothetical protein [Candidatus Eremiobacteraeota bacterium]
MKRAFAFAIACFGLASSAASAQSAAPSPRHVVYGFTYGTQSDLQVHSSGVDSAPGASNNGSGISDFTGGLGDQGTITVDLLSQQPDKSLIIKVSEQAQKTRSAAAATCVVYPTTGVICDPNATVNPEEMTLIRFLAPTFVDPTSIDAKQHWSVRNETPQYSLTADYSIAKNAAGIMTIDEQREIKEQQPSATTNVSTTIGYDFNRTIPLSINEYSIERSTNGTAGYQTVKTQTVLQLTSDSRAASN